MLYNHWSEVPGEVWRWSHFTPDEPNLACPCCGEFYLCTESMNRLERARVLLGKPIRINSGHRCSLHNARVGGAPLSQHKKFAMDVSLTGHNRHEVLRVLRAVGFTTFGFYQTFIHTDIRHGRMWYGDKRAKLLWNL